MQNGFDPFYSSEKRALILFIVTLSQLLLWPLLSGRLIGSTWESPIIKFGYHTKESETTRRHKIPAASQKKKKGPVIHSANFEAQS
jgi:hypothetical protein